MKTTERDGRTVRLLTAGDGLTVPTDVEVAGPDGRTWVGTVATLPMIDAVMESYRESGECLSGTDFWVSGLYGRTVLEIPPSVDHEAWTVTTSDGSLLVCGLE